MLKKVAEGKAKEAEAAKAAAELKAKEAAEAATDAEQAASEAQMKSLEEAGNCVDSALANKASADEALAKAHSKMNSAANAKAAVDANAEATKTEKAKAAADFKEAQSQHAAADAKAKTATHAATEAQARCEACCTDPSKAAAYFTTGDAAVAAAAAANAVILAQAAAGAKQEADVKALQKKADADLAKADAASKVQVASKSKAHASVKAAELEAAADAKAATDAKAQELATTKAAEDARVAAVLSALETHPQLQGFSAVILSLLENCRQAESQDTSQLDCSGEAHTVKSICSNKVGSLLLGSDSDLESMLVRRPLTSIKALHHYFSCELSKDDQFFKGIQGEQLCSMLQEILNSYSDGAPAEADEWIGSQINRYVRNMLADLSKDASGAALMLDHFHKDEEGLKKDIRAVSTNLSNSTYRADRCDLEMKQADKTIELMNKIEEKLDAVQGRDSLADKLSEGKAQFEHDRDQGNREKEQEATKHAEVAKKDNFLHRRFGESCESSRGSVDRSTEQTLQEDCQKENCLAKRSCKDRVCM